MLPDGERSIERILAIRMDNIGDVIMLGPAMRSVRNKYPEAHITLLASPAGSQAAPLLPWIDEVIIWKALWQDVSGTIGLIPDREAELIETIKAGKYDLALIFTSFSQSPYPPAYVCYLAGVPLRVGLSKEFGGGVLTTWTKPPDDSGHQVDRDLSVITAAGIPIGDRDLELNIPAGVEETVDNLLSASGIYDGQPYIIAAPGASCSARRYPVERFSRMVQEIAERTDLTLLIVGSEREISHIQPVMNTANGKNIISLVGKTSVPELAGLVKRSSLVIANNSAALHIADAFQRPMVILYSGSEYRSQWAPRSSPAVLLKRETRCSPCYRFDCPYQMECLDISPASVADVVIGMLNRHGINRRDGEILSVMHEQRFNDANKGSEAII